MTDVSKLLASCGVDEPAESARNLVAAACNISRAELLARQNDRISQAAAGTLSEFVRRRLRHEPVSRILGHRSFWNSEFSLSPAVLDPRPETETLIEAAIARLATRKEQALRILDLGAGSGAILCSLLQEFTNGVGLGVEVSPEACAVAHENIHRLGLGNRASILNVDWSQFKPGHSWDLIVSNPPYIPTETITTLSRDVREWDPVMALNGGKDGLAAYRVLAGLVGPWLADDGLCLLEIGFDQEDTVPGILGATGLVAEAVLRDLSGNPRIVVAKK